LTEVDFFIEKGYLGTALTMGWGDKS